MKKNIYTILLGILLTSVAITADEFPKPYSPPCTERENVFEFTEKPKAKKVAEDKYEITFAVKGYCDVAVAIIDPNPKKELVPGRGIVVRHLGAGVLGANAPVPFQKNSLKQTIYWDGKDDLGFYHKEPNKLLVRVSLGLKPVFHKLFGPTDPRNIPGAIIGIAADADGVYIFSRAPQSHNHVHLRKFDHDVRHVMSLAPHPSNLPMAKLAGRTAIEYEKGQFGIHGPVVQEDIGYDGNVLPGLGGQSVADIQPAIVNKKIFFCNSAERMYQGVAQSFLYYLYTDGSSDVPGMAGRQLIEDLDAGHLWSRFAGSPDGKWLYMVGLSGGHQTQPVVLRIPVEDNRSAELFLGKATVKGRRLNAEPGSDNEHFNAPWGIDCDAQGRIYVADSFNNRIQIFHQRVNI